MTQEDNEGFPDRGLLRALPDLGVAGPEHLESGEVPTHRSTTAPLIQFDHTQFFNTIYRSPIFSFHLHIYSHRSIHNQTPFTQLNHQAPPFLIKATLV